MATNQTIPAISGIDALNAGVAKLTGYKVVEAATGSVLYTDTIVGVNYNGTVTITLPTVATADVGRLYIITDVSGAANGTTNLITISGAGSELVNGGDVTIAAAYGAARLFTNGTAWFTA